MSQEMNYFTAEEIAKSLGVNAASVHRWIDSGKLQYSIIEDEIKKISSNNLSEFAMKYNISLKFLDSINHRFIRTDNSSVTISMAE
jgi:hypothetical protein